MNARLLIAIGIAALGRPESAGGQTYAVSNLGMLDAQRSRGSAAYDMNNLGQLAGSSSIYADGDWTIGAQWSHGRWSFLPEPADSMYIKAWAINDAGQVACSSIISVEESYPVCWSNGVYIELGTLGG
ncbi:MAG: hypothetical protein JNG88_01405, partial [Phycisphaerales bacterium]|nr:hypothetical protein [Phycisphaerales bacterium]